MNWFGVNVVLLEDTDIGEGDIVGAVAVVYGVNSAHSIIKSGRNLDIARVGSL